MRYKFAAFDFPKIARKDLTAEAVRECLEYSPETGQFVWLKQTTFRVRAGDIAGQIKPCGYRFINIYGARYFAHRLAWLLVYGEWPQGIIDHKNRIRSDNRIDNLRQVTVSQNNKNSKGKINKTGARGVYYDKRDGHWYSKITVNGKTIFLGRYTEKDAASKAHIDASLKHNGEFSFYHKNNS